MIEQNVAISPRQARHLVQECFEDLRDQIDGAGPMVPLTDRGDLEMLEQEALAGEAINSLQRQLDGFNFARATEVVANDLLTTRGVHLAQVSKEARALLLSGVARALMEQQRHFIARLHDPLAPHQPHDALFETTGVSPAAAPTAMPAAPTMQQFGPTTSEAVETYLKAKAKGWAGKTARARRWQLGYLVEFLGAATPLVAITAKEIRGYRDTLPKLRAKHGSAKSTGFFSKLTDNPQAQVQNKTARLIFEPTKAFFRWARSEEGLLAVNPAEDIRWVEEKKPKGVRSRRPFSPGELTTLFTAPLFTGCKSRHRRFEVGECVVKDAKFWIPILGYYTGARLGELVQLHVDDVVLDAPIPYLDFNEKSGTGTPKHIKTSAGVRQVPLHPDLLKLGIADLVAQRRKWGHPSKRLFSEIPFGCDGQASTEFSKIFARSMDCIGLKDRALTFHSFRHGAEDAFRNAAQPQYVIDAIMGHSDGKISSHYGEGPSLSLKAEAVSKMALPVHLPGIW